MKILAIRNMKHFFCDICGDIVDEERKAVFEVLKPAIEQTFLGHKDLFGIFCFEFLAEINDLVFFEHFSAIMARPQPYTIRGMRLGERFNSFAVTVRAR